MRRNRRVNCLLDVARTGAMYKSFGVLAAKSKKIKI
jgi:hypothetical protein